MDAARNWHTILPADYTAKFGCPELHVAAFEHQDDPGGPWRCVAVQLPEASRQVINEALHVARRLKARILIVADTADQVARAVARIERRCPHHRRVSYERAQAGAFGRPM